MPVLEVERSIVTMIDMQGKLMSMIDRPEQVLESASRLLKLAALFQVPVVVTEQYPKGLGPTHPELAALVEANQAPTRRLEKDSFSCCQEPSFDSAMTDLLPDQADRHLVVAGIEAHICVVQTVLELLDRRVAGQHEVVGDVFVCWDCVSGRGAEYRRWAFERMQQAGATITNCESVGFEWARNKDHPQFRTMSGLFRQGQPS